MTRSQIGVPGSVLLVLFAAALPAAARDDVPADWHRVATAADRGRLRTWRQAWIDALAKARATGHGREVAAQGALFDPDRALAGA